MLPTPWLQPFFPSTGFRSTDLRVPLKPGAGGTLEDYLRNTRAQVRGLFWEGSPGPGLARAARMVNNIGTANAIQQLPNGAALLDEQLPPLSAHHQKILVVQGDAGLIAFLGGMDFMPNRVLPNAATGEPWSDVHLRLVGPAAVDVRKVVENRWMWHPKTRALDEKLGLSDKASAVQRSDFAFPPPTPTAGTAFETVTAPRDSPRSTQRKVVAVGRTFGKGPKDSPPPFGFAPAGDYSAWSLIETGIKKAVRWIYVEDQYLVSRMAREALLAKLKEPNFEFLLILMSNSGSVGEFKFLRTARNEFRRDLIAADRTKWGLYTLTKCPDAARQNWCGDFVHSKIWIFDDSYVVVGSANCDNRGYTLDSEVVAGIVESSDIDPWLGKTFAIDLRTRLWAKYLGLPDALVSDFRKGLAWWKAPPATAMVMENSGGLHRSFKEKNAGNRIAGSAGLAVRELDAFDIHDGPYPRAGTVQGSCRLS